LKTFSGDVFSNTRKTYFSVPRMGEIGLEHVCRPGKVKTSFVAEQRVGVGHPQPADFPVVVQEVVAFCVTTVVDVE